MKMECLMDWWYCYLVCRYLMLICAQQNLAYLLHYANATEMSKMLELQATFLTLFVNIISHIISQTK